MKLLLLSDLHRDRRAARELVTMAQVANVDVVVGAGDFATTRRGLSDVIDILAEMTVPTVLVPGNSETESELSAACVDWPTAQVLHGSGTEILGVSFWGIGGAVPVTPFGGWSFDFTEEQAALLLADCPSCGVLVSHSPPRGILDRSSSGTTLGSVSVRDAMISRQPRLLVCGHIHASGGQVERVGSTVVVNAGPAGVVWDLDE